MSERRSRRELDKAIRREPRNAALRVARGDYYRERGKMHHASALRDYGDAIRLATESGDDDALAKAHFGMGLVYLREGKFREAIRDYERANGLNPGLRHSDYADAYINRGNTYYDKGEYDRAIENCDKAIELNPKDPDAYNNRGITYDNKGEYDHAIEDYDKAIELDPKDPEAYINRGNAYYNKGEYDCAIEDCDKAIELDLNDPDAYNNRGYLYNAKGEFGKAIVSLDESIGLDKEYSLARINRGIAHHSLGDIESALSDFDAAVRLCYPSYREWFISTDTRVIGGIEMRERAKGLLDSLISWPPKDSSDCYYRGVRLRYDNQNKNAREYFELAQEWGFKDTVKIQQHLDSIDAHA